MRNTKGILSVLIPVVITISLFVVFYSRIESKPNHPGFWFIFAMGMSVGVALTRILKSSNDNNKPLS
jgi:hypothetical protein